MSDEKQNNQADDDTERREIDHTEAKNIATRLIAGSFRRDGERMLDPDRPRFSVPCRSDHDDDCLIIAYIEQQISRDAALREAQEENAKLRKMADAAEEWYWANNKAVLGTIGARERVLDALRLLGRYPPPEAARPKAARPKPVTDAEKKVMLQRAEQLWQDLRDNELGGYSGINRPFYIAGIFKEIYAEGERAGIERAIEDCATLTENSCVGTNDEQLGNELAKAFRRLLPPAAPETK